MKTPNKMKSPMKDGKKHDHPHDRINGVPGSGLEGMGKDGRPVAKMKAPVKFNEKLRAAKAAGKLSDEFAAVVKMKSPAKMASGFKMKSAPVNMRTPGSVAKMAGVSPAKIDTTKIKNVGKDLLAGAKGFADGSRYSISKGISRAKREYNNSKESREGNKTA